MARKSDAVKIAELQLMETTLKTVLSNPGLTFVLGFVALEIAQTNKITGNIETSVAEVTLGAITTAQAVAPLLPLLAQSTGKSSDVLGKLVPAALAAGA